MSVCPLRLVKGQKTKLLNPINLKAYVHKEKENYYVHNKFLFFLVITLFNQVFILIRLIPEGSVDKNLGPDRLAGSKALDP